MKKFMITLVMCATLVFTISAQKEDVYFGSFKISSLTPGMTGGSIWSRNPSYTSTFGLHVGGLTVSAFRTRDLLDRLTDGNQIGLLTDYKWKFEDCKLAFAHDLLLFDNDSLSMSIPKVTFTYSKGVFSGEAMIAHSFIFKGGSIDIVRLSPSVTIDRGFLYETFLRESFLRLYIWGKYSNNTFSIPAAVQVGKEFYLSDEISWGVEMVYHLKDLTAKKGSSWWANIHFVFLR